MNLWQQYSLRRAGAPVSQGISLHFEKGIDPGFRRLCIQFAGWLRKTYCFPVHLNIYIKNCEKIRLLGGQIAYGGFRYFEHRPPYIRIPAKIEPHLREEYDSLELSYGILGSLVHELTHYFQWVSGVHLSERQANFYRFRIIEAFCKEKGLPY